MLWRGSLYCDSSDTNDDIRYIQYNTVITIYTILTIYYHVLYLYRYIYYNNIIIYIIALLFVRNFYTYLSLSRWSYKKP
ncbi:hypothetical protein Dtox_1843 [Desulfofarcimen acetoxidans DSM 771]|uniref:Uncharacterized protein n=1 Tax=Desulfofarcimen acetoxidans (strain ATCC 49208 / DSM 771 / KCTC 5769 / VKM B-1644 / 5575) TaxID=485916 RepID=C8VXN5_DESAS|nr:hypothetical protein Dtox_1843 [Desulfofarcimen acetoxidans DSM 771]